MKQQFNLLRINLRLFDGEGGGAAAPAASEGSAPAETKAVPGISRREKTGDTSRVVYGKPPVETPAAKEGEKAPAAGESTQPKETEEERSAKFRELIRGPYKDLYTQETQSMIDRRFKQTKETESQLEATRPILDMLAQKYGVADGDPAKIAQAIQSDDTYWAEQAEQAGMSPEQFRQFRALQTQNRSLLQQKQETEARAKAEAQVQKWTAEMEKLRGTPEAPGEYPELDLATEIQDPRFKAMLQAGVDVKSAYEAAHINDIRQRITAETAKSTEKKVVSNIQAKGARPAENGASSSAAITYKSDPSKLTKEERAEVAKRAMRGEKISF